MPMVVTEACTGCKHTDCVVVCPCDCFREGETMLYIDPDACIDCEACIPECPVEAIYRDADVPQKWLHFVELNRSMSKQLPAITEKKPPLT
jgi:ferredoxin